MTVARFYLRVLGGQSLYGMPTSGDMMYTLGAMEQQIIVIETALKQFSAFVPFAGMYPFHCPSNVAAIIERGF